MTTVDDYFPAPEPAGGWRRADPAGLGINPERLANALTYHDEHPTATRANGGALAIIYRGHLVAESYVTGISAGPRPWNAFTCNDIKSSTKSVFGTAVGLFLEEFAAEVSLESLLVGNSPADSLIPQIWSQPLTDPRKRQIKLKHALAMTAGHTTPEPWLAPSSRHHLPGYRGAFQLYEYCFGWWKFAGIPDQHQLLFAPGTDFNYSNYGLELVALAMRNISGEEVGPYLYDRVLKPMGLPLELRRNAYQLMPYQDENEWNFGVEPGWGRGGSLGCNAYGADGSASPYGYNSIVGSTFRCTARDFARLGYLWLRGGRWGNRQLVPAGWLRQATRRFVRDDGSSHANYGYTFWVQDQWEDVPADTFMSRGHNLNDCYIIPSLDLVVARQGNSNPNRPERDRFSHQLIRQIIAALPAG